MLHKVAGVVLLLLGSWRASAAEQAPQPRLPPSYPQPPPNYPPPPPQGPYPGQYPAPYGPGYGYPGQYVQARPPGAQRHDGFYLRMQLGPGFTSAKASSGADSVKVSGGGVGLSLAVGGAIRDNLIIFGEIVVDSATSPSREIGGLPAGTFQNGSANLGGVGAGLAYYIMPANVYLSGAVVATTFSLNDSNHDNVGSTDTGLGIDLTIGKEWFVSANWGLGVAVQVLAASMRDQQQFPGGDRPRWNAAGFAVAFSATFN
jgi:hypothetical protein